MPDLDPEWKEAQREMYADLWFYYTEQKLKNTNEYLHLKDGLEMAEAINGYKVDITSLYLSFFINNIKINYPWDGTDDQLKEAIRATNAKMTPSKNLISKAIIIMRRRRLRRSSKHGTQQTR